MSAIKILRSIVKACIPAAVREDLRYRRGAHRLRAVAAARKPLRERPFGVNVFGCFDAATGLAESCRTVAGQLREAGIPVALHDLAAGGTADGAPYCVNLFHANPDQLSSVLAQVPAPLWEHRYNIGFWMWEQERLPAPWLR